MKLRLKRQVLAFVKAHDDGSQETAGLIKDLEYECNYADCDANSVSVDDLNNYRDQAGLRGMLGRKDGEPYTADDCERVAEEIAELVADEFGENLDNAIRYC